MSNLKITSIQKLPVYSNNGNFSCPNFGKTPNIPDDKVEISNNKKKLDWKTIIIGGIVLKVVTGIIGLKLYKANYINKAQKTFKEVFMRDNITKDETIKMLKRYKEIKKIKDKDKYIKALFEETKKNYGFEKGCLELKTFNESEHPNLGGFVKKAVPYVNINKDRKPAEIMNTMHHEMKHKQQEYMMMNYCEDLEEYLCRTNSAREVKIKKGDLGTEFVEELKKEYPKWFEQFNLTELNKKNVPEKYTEYVEHLLKDAKTYKESGAEKGIINKEYFNNFLEQDARNAGFRIEKLLRWFIPV